jgi:large-conductance mechanosensitive channel
MYSSREVNYQNIVIDVAITIIISAAVGAVIAMVNDKLK